MPLYSVASSIIDRVQNGWTFYQLKYCPSPNLGELIGKAGGENLLDFPNAPFNQSNPDLRALYQLKFNFINVGLDWQNKNSKFGVFPSFTEDFEGYLSRLRTLPLVAQSLSLYRSGKTLYNTWATPTIELQEYNEVVTTFLLKIEEMQPRDIVINKLPYQDKSIVQDLGTKPRQIRVQFLLVGDSYEKKLRLFELISSLPSTNKGGSLVHFNYGLIPESVYMTEFRILQQSQTYRSALCECNFIVADMGTYSKLIRSNLKEKLDLTSQILASVGVVWGMLKQVKNIFSILFTVDWVRFFSIKEALDGFTFSLIEDTFNAVGLGVVTNTLNSINGLVSVTLNDTSIEDIDNDILGVKAFTTTEDLDEEGNTVAVEDNSNNIQLSSPELEHISIDNANYVLSVDVIELLAEDMSTANIERVTNLTLSKLDIAKEIYPELEASFNMLKGQIITYINQYLEFKNIELGGELQIITVAEDISTDNFLSIYNLYSQEDKEKFFELNKNYLSNRNKLYKNQQVVIF